ncbi:MAG: DUF438 domain-containing protein [Tissierellia bacterium]|nr:DUF438 domain-containing protein [Tissierellia bacterium]
MENQERAKVLKSILEQLHAGKSVEEVKDEFLQSFGDVSAAEIAEAERQLIKEGLPVEEIQNLCDVHASVFEDRIVEESNDREDGHPLMIFQQENKGLEKFLDGEFQRAKAEYFDENKKERLSEALNRLSKIDRHYSRKENLFFPYLEMNNITAPPKVMWGVDDEIRGHIKSSIESLDEGNLDLEQLKLAEEKVRSMITKENEILIPLLIHNMDEEDWKVVAKESRQIGYAFAEDIEGASPSDAVAWLKDEDESVEITDQGKIKLPSGFFEGKELEMLLNTLPSDITFVGADGKVHYFSEGKERVFPRTRTIIGRKVEDCHPPKSLDAVERLIEAFKSGEKDEEYFWLQRGGKFILIRYYAVRDEADNYMGVLEVTEEISELRKLEGEKTL